MNLKRRFILANAATAVIPVIITALFALAFLFIFSELQGTNLSLANYQKLAQIKLELMNSQNSVLRETPEAVEEKSFQNHLQEQLAAINGELIIVKNDHVIFASQKVSEIDLAQCLEAGNLNEPVVLGNQSYTIQAIPLNFKDGSIGSVLLLAPVDPLAKSLRWFLILAGAVFILSFAGTNIFVSYQVSRSILKPLNNLQKAAAVISCGNLNYQIVEEGDNEIQALCRDLEQMRIKLKDSIHTQLKYEDNRKMLVSSISHDLKTPVTSIKGYVEGILDGIANTPEKTDRYLQTIYAKTQQVDQMIDDLLLYAKLDLNQIPFNFEKTDIEEYLKDCLAESEPELEENGINMTFLNELCQKRNVLLDRERMKRVIMNILDNSRKYMNKEQGEISILLRETYSSIVIEVHDNGAGIRESDLPHIFDRFYRSDRSRSEIKGSGLGLAIAKQIIEGHKGRVWAVSHGDEGTSIMLSLGNYDEGRRK